MDVLLDALAMWGLLILLLIWFGNRLVAVRELELRDYLELQEYAARQARDTSAEDVQPWRTRIAQNYGRPSAGVCSSVAVTPCGPLEETHGVVPPRLHPVVRRGSSPESRRAAAEPCAIARPSQAPT
jgi:hypothetical protein